MQARVKLALALSSLLLAACSGSSNAPRATVQEPARNDDGSVVTAVITARFDPSVSVVPSPINLVLLGTRDLTINIPVANPNNFADPQVAINALDGFSTTAPVTFQLSSAPRATSLVGGSSIRMFEVTLTGPGGRVTGVVRELASPGEFVVAQTTSDTSGRTVAIVPTKPLKQVTSYMIVVTNGVKDGAGNDATPDTPYFLTQRTAPLCANGASTDPLIPTASACALEPLRGLTNAQEAAAAGAGVNRSKIVLSWVYTTQSITPVLSAARALAQAFPATTRLAPTGINLSQLGLGLPNVADIYIGTQDLPYYLDAPSAQNPTAVLTTFWQATPGGYVAPFNQLGLDPTSTNLTFANPVPARKSVQTVPVLMTVPNAGSGKTKPASGWPIVIFNHGITRNRTDMLAIAGTMAAQGFAVIAIDQPLHGVGPTSPFYIENTPFGPISGERTFDLDLSNNSTGAPGPDGTIDASGTYYINLSSLLTSRDNLRQSEADLFTLTKAIPAMSYDGDATPDFDASRIEFVGQSLGSITGIPFLALEPNVNVSLTSVPGGQIAYLLNGSPTFGPRIRAGLAAAGVVAGSVQFDQFLGAAQTVVDSADPINYTFVTATDKNLTHLVVGDATHPADQVVPPVVAGAPLAGGEPLVKWMGLAPIVATTQSATGIRGVTRFTQGDHGSLLSPASSAAVTAEMQGEMASMLASGGNAVLVQNTSVIRTQ